MKKALLPLLLLGLAGCTTKNYYAQCEMPPEHEAAMPMQDRIAPPPPAYAPMGKAPMAVDGQRTQYYTSQPYVKDKGAYGMKNEWKNDIPPADWDPNGPGPKPYGNEPAYPAEPKKHMTLDEADAAYQWNKDRKDRKEGEYFKPTPPGSAALRGGELVDPLSFPHFCGPGARTRGAC